MACKTGSSVRSSLNCLTPEASACSAAASGPACHHCAALSPGWPLQCFAELVAASIHDDHALSIASGAGSSGCCSTAPGAFFWVSMPAFPSNSALTTDGGTASKHRLAKLRPTRDDFIECRSGGGFIGPVGAVQDCAH